MTPERTKALLNFGKNIADATATLFHTFAETVTYPAVDPETIPYPPYDH